MTPRARRRRLLLWSAPVVAVLVAVVVAVSAAAIVSRSAGSAFARGDVDTLRRDVSVLQVVGVIDSAATDFAAGSLAVLEGRLDEAERRFAASAEERPACGALANLLLVRETMGDDAVGANNGPLAIGRYRSALSVASPDGRDACFADNTDPDGERRAVLADSVPRLERKLAILERPLAPPPPAPPAGAPPPPAAGGTRPTVQPPEERLLNPESGDPLDKLQQILEDAAAARGGP